MTRHTVICRQDARAPHVFVTLEQQSSEGGIEWAERKGANTTFEVAVRQLVERITGIEGGELQNITITPRTMAEVIEAPPLVEASYGKMFDTQPGAGITILAPILHNQSRDRFEMWTTANRTPGVGLWASGKVKYIQRLLTDQVLTYFHAGPERRMGEQESFKKFAAQLGSHLEELWVRPAWEIANPEMLPDVFPKPRPAPVTPSHILEQQEKRRVFVQHMKNSKRQLAGQGYTYNQQTRSWSKPE